MEVLILLLLLTPPLLENMRLVEQALHSLIDPHLLYLLGAHRADLAVRDELGFLPGELGVLIAQLEGSLIVLVDHVIKEQREFLQTIRGPLGCDAYDILAVRDEQEDELLTKSNKGV